MNRFIAILLFGLVASAGIAQIQIPVGGAQSTGPSRKNTRATSRTLTGTVLDKSDKPVPNTIVYLKNTKTLAMKTYITQSDGAYRFPELSLNVDYELYAQKEGRKSNTKNLSQFDDREKPNINLLIDMDK